MKRLLTIVLLLFSVGVFAQSERSTDFGGIVSAEAEVGLGGPFGLSVEEELRFENNCTQFDRWLNSVGVDYTCLHNRMNIGLTADYIRRHNDRGYYENRGRLGLQVTYTEDWRRFRFQVRSKAIHGRTPRQSAFVLAQPPESDLPADEQPLQVCPLDRTFLAYQRPQKRWH